MSNLSEIVKTSFEIQQDHLRVNSDEQKIIWRLIYFMAKRIDKVLLIIKKNIHLYKD